MDTPLSGKGLIVLGANRSGTSAVAAALRALGVYFGQDQDLPAGGWYIDYEAHENSRIVELNKLILGTFETGGLPCRSLPDNWESFAMSDDLLDTATRLLRDLFAGHSVWGWKDPRTSLLLPFYERVFERLNLRPAYLLPLRHPFEVAKGVFERQLLPIEEGIGCWIDYMLAILTQGDLDRLFLTTYEAFLADPTLILEKVRHTLDLSPLDQLAWRRVRAAVQVGLHRNRSQDYPLPEIAEKLWKVAASIAEQGEFVAGSQEHKQALAIAEEWREWQMLTRMSMTYAALVRWRTGGQSDRSIYRGECRWHSCAIHLAQPAGDAVDLQFQPLISYFYFRNVRFYSETGSVPAELVGREGAFLDVGGENDYRLVPFAEKAHVTVAMPEDFVATRLEFEFQMACGPFTTAQIAQRLARAYETARFSQPGMRFRQIST